MTSPVIDIDKLHKLSKIKWTIDQEDYVINRVRENRFLWDHSNTNYSRRKLRSITYQNIAKQFMENWPAGPFVDGDTVRQKFNYLKMLFFKENRLLWCKKSGSSTDELALKSSWPHYSALQFLSDLQPSFNSPEKVSEPETLLTVNEDVNLMHLLDEPHSPMSTVMDKSSQESPRNHPDSSAVLEKAKRRRHESGSKEDKLMEEAVDCLRRSIEVREKSHPYSKAIASMFEAKALTLSKERSNDLFQETINFINNF